MPETMKCFRSVIGAAALTVVLAGCGSSGSGSVDAKASWTSGATPSTQAQPSQTAAPNPTATVTAPPVTVTTKPQDQPLTIKVVGTCSSDGNQGMHLESSGFTPGGTYQTTATYPDGRGYTYLADGGFGVADSEGHASKWRWNCTVSQDTGQRDPVGVYHVRIWDLATHREADATFTVSYN